MPHFHSMVPDGVYAAAPGEPPRFYPVRSPEKRDVAAVAERVAARVMALMEPEGGLEEEEGELQPMAELCSASIAGRIASGPNAGQRQRMLGQSNAEAGLEEERFEAEGSRCARVEGRDSVFTRACRFGIQIEKDWNVFCATPRGPGWPPSVSTRCRTAV
jgi:hypothetical protein